MSSDVSEMVDFKILCMTIAESHASSYLIQQARMEKAVTSTEWTADSLRTFIINGNVWAEMASNLGWVGLSSKNRENQRIHGDKKTKTTGDQAGTAAV